MVGTTTAVYLDDAAPAPTYSDADLQAIGSMFDAHLYPIDTTAFGRESDIEHEHLAGVEGESYGATAVFMERHLPFVDRALH